MKTIFPTTNEETEKRLAIEFEIRRNLEDVSSVSQPANGVRQCVCVCVCSSVVIDWRHRRSNTNVKLERERERIECLASIHSYSSYSYSSSSSFFFSSSSASYRLRYSFDSLNANVLKKKMLIGRSLMLVLVPMITLIFFGILIFFLPSKKYPNLFCNEVWL